MRPKQYQNRHYEHKGPRKRRIARDREDRHWTSTIFGIAIFAFLLVFNLVGISVLQIFGLPAMAYYPKCDAARLAGAAPIARDAPGYRSELDDDGDGLACEPYLGPK